MAQAKEQQMGEEKAQQSESMTVQTTDKHWAHSLVTMTEPPMEQPKAQAKEQQMGEE